VSDSSSLTQMAKVEHSGSQMKRNWPIGETKDLLQTRWRKFLVASDRREAFKETRDRKVDRSYLSFGRSTERLEPLSALSATSPMLDVARYAFRSLDRQWIIKDPRLGDYMKPVLWLAHSDKQAYMTSILTDIIGRGPAVMASAEART
jgi:Type ISP C-terminal specificity domain